MQEKEAGLEQQEQQLQELGQALKVGMVCRPGAQGRHDFNCACGVPSPGQMLLFYRFLFHVC